MTLFHLLVAGAFVLAFARLKVLDVRRSRAARRLGRNRGTTVVPLIHRLETVTLLGLPLYRYVSVPLANEIVAALARIPSHDPVDLVVHLPGGIDLDAGRIAAAMRGRSGAVTLLVPACGLSDGQVLADAADAVIVGPGAVLGERGRPTGVNGTSSLDDEIPTRAGASNESLPAAVWPLLALYVQPPRHRGSPLFLPLNRRGRSPASQA